MSESIIGTFPKHPKFSELLQKISANLNEDFSSKCVKTRYEQTVSVLHRERSDFLKARTIQIVSEEYSTGNDTSHKRVRESLAAAKLLNMTNVQHCGKTVKLGNIEKKDLEGYLKPEESKLILVPHIEQQINHYKQTIYDICGATVNRNPSTIVQNNRYMSSKLAAGLNQLQAKQLEYVQRAGEALKLYDKVAKQRTTPEQKEKHLERVTSLSAAATKLSLMVDNLEARIVSDTYTAENVSALKAVHAAIEAKQRSLEKELSHDKHVLDAYLALGDDFTALVDLYRELKSNLETYQWALKS